MTKSQIEAAVAALRAEVEAQANGTTEETTDEEVTE